MLSNVYWIIHFSSTVHLKQAFDKKGLFSM